MAKVFYSPAALRDLEEIGDYISKDLKSPLAALNTVNQILDKIDMLDDFPFMGALLSSIYGAADTGDTRFLVCGNHMAFYRADEHRVHIDRILYGRRDYIKVLFPPLEQAKTRPRASLWMLHSIMAQRGAKKRKVSELLLFSRKFFSGSKPVLADERERNRHHANGSEKKACCAYCQCPTLTSLSGSFGSIYMSVISVPPP